jgi:beta-lactamase class A
MQNRRSFLALAGSMALGSAAMPLLVRAAGSADPGIDAAPDLAALEAVSGGRLGVTLAPAGGAVVFGHRVDERFPMCSTFKCLLAAAVLAHADRGDLSLDQRLPMRESDVIAHAPMTGRHVGKDVSVRDLCRATMVWSDNPAANLLLPLVGGPPGLTRFLREHGDALTRSDRYEPEMNLFAPGDPRDTTSPAAMAGNLRRFVLGDALAPGSRAQLADWLIDNHTGDRRIRAGVPAGWRVGDKTGTSRAQDGIANDVAVLWPVNGGEAWVLTCFLQGATALDSAGRDGVLRRAAVLASAHLPA